MITAITRGIDETRRTMYDRESHDDSTPGSIRTPSTLTDRMYEDLQQEFNTAARSNHKKNMEIASLTARLTDMTTTCQVVLDYLDKLHHDTGAVGLHADDIRSFLNSLQDTRSQEEKNDMSDIKRGYTEEGAQAPLPHDGQDGSIPPTRGNLPTDQTYQGDHVSNFPSAEQESDKGPSSGDFLNGPSKGPTSHSTPASTNQQGDAFNRASQQASMGSGFTNSSTREQSRLNGNQSRQGNTASGGTHQSSNMYPSNKVNNRNKQINKQPSQTAKKKNVHH